MDIGGEKCELQNRQLFAHFCIPLLGLKELIMRKYGSYMVFFLYSDNCAQSFFHKRGHTSLIKSCFIPSGIMLIPVVVNKIDTDKNKQLSLVSCKLRLQRLQVLHL